MWKRQNRLYAERCTPMQETLAFILPLADVSARLSQVGGKGASLARMAAAGLPVPAGFQVTTTAYRRFVTENGLQEQILSAVSAVAADQQAQLEEASKQIAGLFALRAFVLRAGALTGQGEDLFFLSIDEILAVLGGDDAPLSSLPARRATYARYCALPPYPTLIRGHFDPLQWAADPQRRSDVFDASGSTRTPASATITGFPGAAGIVEGRARVIATAEEGDQLQPGEILVTTVTNVSWTPLFPRAAAVVTDVGTPLSHAAIVARELGIPVVVGCGNATMRLHTGDWVRVNGGQGTVEVLRAWMLASCQHFCVEQREAKAHMYILIEEGGWKP